MDLGHYLLAQYDDGEVRFCYKYSHPQNPAHHQLSRVGNQRYPGPIPYGRPGNLTRNVYMVFDTSKIRNAQRAHIEFYVLAANAATNFTGDWYNGGPDTQERIHMHAIDRFTGQQVLDAPFRDEANNERDLDIFRDLEDGPSYGSFEMSAKEVAVDKISPAPTNPVADMDCSDANRRLRTCGRWLRIELNQDAIKDINKSQGTWALGWSLGTRDYFKASQEDFKARGLTGISVETRVLWGGYIDVAFANTQRPKPRLIINASPG